MQDLNPYWIKCVHRSSALAGPLSGKVGSGSLLLMLSKDLYKVSVR